MIQRHINMLIVLCAVFMARTILRVCFSCGKGRDPSGAWAGQQKGTGSVNGSDTSPVRGYWKFPALEGPVLVAQLFGMADTAAAVATLDCVSWKVVGVLWLVIGPCSFVACAIYQARKLINNRKMLQFLPSLDTAAREPSPQRPSGDIPATKQLTSSAETSTDDLSIPTVNRAWRFLVHNRFLGSWVMTDNTQSCSWAWLMVPYTDQGLYFLSWSLSRKVIAAAAKNFLDAEVSCLAFAGIFSIDLFSVLFQPFCDITCNLAQALASIANLLAVLPAFAQLVFDPGVLPLWFDSSFIVCAATAGTVILAAQAFFNAVALLAGTLIKVPQGPYSKIKEADDKYHTEQDLAGEVRSSGMSAETKVTEAHVDIPLISLGAGAPAPARRSHTASHGLGPYCIIGDDAAPSGAATGLTSPVSDKVGSGDLEFGSLSVWRGPPAYSQVAPAEAPGDFVTMSPVPQEVWATLSFWDPSQSSHAASASLVQ